MSELTNAVRTALVRNDMNQATEDVKGLLCDELARVDPVARIHRTDYFNHTYVPDIVLDWDDREPREVFLRFVSSPGRLLVDGKRLGASGPVIFDLSTAARPDRGKEEIESADEAAAQASEQSPSLMLTDTEATEHLRPDKSQNMVERLVLSNVLRGGRGRWSEASTRETIEVSRAGYGAAMAAQRDTVKAAVKTARRVLEPALERRVERSAPVVDRWGTGRRVPSECS